MIGNGRTPVGLLPVFCTQKELERERSGGYEETSVYGFISPMTEALKIGIGLVQIPRGVKCG